MTTFFIVLAILTGLALVATFAAYCVRVDRAAVARAEIRVRQRQAEAEVQRVVQDTVQRMFNAARRQP